MIFRLFFIFDYLTDFSFGRPGFSVERSEGELPDTRLGERPPEHLFPPIAAAVLKKKKKIPAFLGMKWK